MKPRKLIITLSIILFALFGSVHFVSAQTEIKFRDLTFDQAMAEAAKTNKIIFVDVTRNTPGKMSLQVEKEVFTADSIAKFFNNNCISIRVNMNTDEGKKFAPRLAMLMYPVYVFHDKDGSQLSFISSSQILKDPASLMQKARASLYTAQQKVANTREIKFEESSWKAALAKAKKENKLVFLDAYTEWCRPCIKMAKDVFTLDKVADFYNDNFINVTMDMEKGEGPVIVKKYQIGAYPAFLFVNGDGEIVFKDGGYQEAAQFIEVGKAAVKAKNAKK